MLLKFSYQESGSELDRVEGGIPVLAHDERAGPDVIFSALKTNFKNLLNFKCR